MPLLSCLQLIRPIGGAMLPTSEDISEEPEIENSWQKNHFTRQLKSGCFMNSFLNRTRQVYSFYFLLNLLPKVYEY